MAFKSTKTESELKDIQRSKMEESPGTTVSYSIQYVMNFISCFFPQGKVRQQLHVWVEVEVLDQGDHVVKLLQEE
jgi:hypothetical protein